MKHGHDDILVALAGQPNCGKSTIFNLLTGARQHVANFPGVTVEKKQGAYKDNGRRIEVVDLPGTYSLTSYTQEERVARDFLLLERPEVVVAVMDASNLERHLYLLFQLIEMRVPVIACLNMIDVAERRSIKVNADHKVSAESSMDIPMPKVPYIVLFSAGEGHEVEQEGPFVKNTVVQSSAEYVRLPADSSNQGLAENSCTTKQSVAVEQPVAVEPASSTAYRVTGQRFCSGPGAEMAMKMMLTVQIAISVLLAFIFGGLTFWFGYSIGQSKNGKQ